MIIQTVTIPAPCKWLNANERLHWRKEHERKKLWREVAGWAVRRYRPTPLARAHVDVELWFATNRVRDAANYHPTIKAVIDGLVTDGGMLPNDSDEYLTGPVPRPGTADDRPSPGFVGMRLTFHGVPQGSSPSGEGVTATHLRTGTEAVVRPGLLDPDRARVETSATGPAAPGGAS